jgi:hypothetical protein
VSTGGGEAGIVGSTLYDALERMTVIREGLRNVDGTATTETQAVRAMSSRLRRPRRRARGDDLPQRCRGLIYLTAAPVTISGVFLPLGNAT